MIENQKISHSEINSVNIFLLKNFGLYENVDELMYKLIKSRNISDEIIVKCWARVYTFESSFFKFHLEFNAIKKSTI